MAQYINKSAVVAEIEKLIYEIYAGRPFDSLSREKQVAIWYIKSIMSSVNTLEVKEVDLDDQDIYSILYLERMVMRDFGDKEYSHEELCQEVLKRFKAQKGKEVCQKNRNRGTLKR